MASELAVVTRPAVAALEWTPEQRQMIRDTFANGASDAEFAVLMETARVWGLDPFKRQIYFVQRYDRAKGRLVWATQVSIDGMRVMAERTGLYAGQDEPEFEHDGPERKRIVLCRVRVYRRDWQRPIVGVAYFDEYVQKTKEGRPTQFWNEKPHVMIAKCAEALGLRKAFPEQLANAYAPEEMGSAEIELQRPAAPRPRPVPILDAEHEDAAAPDHPALAELRGRLADGDAVPTFDALVQAFAETVGALGADDGGAKAAGLRACYAHLEETLGLRGQRGKFKSAVDALETARAAQKRAAAPRPAVLSPDYGDVMPATIVAVEQAERDYAAARSRDEVDAIAAECAKLKLAKNSAQHKRLVAAYKAAVARLAPPPTDGTDGPQGGPRPANDPSGEDPADAAERAAIEGERGGAQAHARFASVAAARAAWEAHLTDGRHENAIAVAKSYAKHLALGDFAPLPREALMRVAIDRLAAEPMRLSELVAVAKLHDAVKAKAWRDQQPRPARAQKAAAALAIATNARGRAA